ncbi:hypothetical protein ABW20_dc0107219 [Dactylellina cionopaga]|nr:hypothetical protein ABW20_dc0107219 [Dactylellina cionopaga]
MPTSSKDVDEGVRDTKDIKDAKETKDLEIPKPIDPISNLSCIPENIDEAIKRIKLMATERIRQKAIAARASLAVLNPDSLPSKENASKAGNNAGDGDVDGLISLAPQLNLGMEQKDTTFDRKHKGDTVDSAPEPVKSVADDTDAKVDDTKRREATPKDFKTIDSKSGDTKPSVLKPEDKKPSIIVVPKPKPRATEPKLPQTKDGFTPQPWVKRRYTISQLLLLGEVLPYVVCPRDHFNIQCFSYDIVHIPGLGNESTGNALVDHQILTLNLRTELVAFQFFTTYGYRYLERFKSPDHTLYVKGLWVEVRGSAGLRDHGGYRNAYRPKAYANCVKEGLIKENQEAEGE